MPTYEYECSSCGKTFEAVQKMSDAPLTDCLDPACGATGTLKKLISSGAGLIFRGSGFYVNDYKKSGSAGTGNAAPAKKEGEPGAGCACAAAANGECPLANKK